MRKLRHFLRQGIELCKCTVQIMLFPFAYILLFIPVDHTQAKIDAVVLSYKRWYNLPYVILGLRRQQIIKQIHVLHNKPSRLFIPRCQNVFYQKNYGCGIRHSYAKNLSAEYVLFCDDDVFLVRNISNHILRNLQNINSYQVSGLIGITCNKNNNTPYTSGEVILNVKKNTFVDIIIGRFHIVSKQALTYVNSMKEKQHSIQDEDDIELNLTLQLKYKEPSVVLGCPYPIFDLCKFSGREFRPQHYKERDNVVRKFKKKGWSSFVT